MSTPTEQYIVWLDQLERERDELRAEVERLRSILGGMADLPTWAEEMGELQAEIERLRAALGKHHSQMRLADGDWGEPWTCGTCQMRT